MLPHHTSEALNVVQSGFITLLPIAIPTSELSGAVLILRELPGAVLILRELSDAVLILRELSDAVLTHCELPFRYSR